MNHYVQYHNAEVEGGRPQDMAGPYTIHTNKSIKKVQAGDVVWQIVGERRPRVYDLARRFVVDKAGPSDCPDYKFMIVGKEGRQPEARLVLNDLPWFSRLKKKTGGFPFGFTRLDEPDLITELERLIP
jgi:hypothetical protein